MRGFLLIAVSVWLLLSAPSPSAAKRGKRVSVGRKGKQKVQSHRKAKVPVADADEGLEEDETEDAFDEVAKHLKRSGGAGFDDYEVSEIRRALSKLASAQSALKTMDGATHQFVNAFKEASSLAARHDQFVSNGSPKKKEAAKLYEYVTTVERALQAAEICQAAGNRRPAERAEWLQAAGLVEVRRVTVEHGKLACTVSVLAQLAAVEEQGGQAGQGGKGAKEGRGSREESERQRRTKPVRFLPGELVLAVTEGRGEEGGEGPALVRQTLRVLSQEAQTVTLKSVGFVEEEVSLQPTLLQLALSALEGVRECLLPTDGTEQGAAAATAGATAGAGSASTAALLSKGLEDPAPAAAANETARPASLRIVGHSTGGAVGAYMALILDGSLQSPHKLLSNATRFAGTFSRRVRCVALGPPPCLSRSLVPRFVTSVLCGDDIVARASPESMGHLQERALRALEAGAGRGGFSSLSLGGLTSWVGDMTAVAGKGLALYSGSQHDLSGLCVPGRVFFCKSRSLQQGASIQRVMRGNWKEDVLWLLHEVLLSDKMLAHHTLDYSIKTLARL